MLLESQRRNERACKRIAGANGTLREKGGTVQRVIDFFYFIKKIGTSETCSDVELVMGLEPAACSLRMSCSTN